MKSYYLNGVKRSIEVRGVGVGKCEVVVGCNLCVVGIIWGC